MRRHRLCKLAYHSLTVLQWSSGIIVTIVGASLKADIEEVRAWFPAAVRTLTWSQNNAWLLIPILTVVVGFAQVVRRTLGAPWVWAVVHSLLDILQKRAFGEEPEAPLHHHRATLFRHVTWKFCLRRWPWSGWLVPVERSGHATRRSSVFFRAPDDADRAEGVAGQTWACSGVIFRDNLPNLDGTASTTPT